MKIRKKRKPDFRRIGPSRTYSIAEFAEAIQRNPATVRSWIRQGMPVLDNLKPVLIEGEAAKDWLKLKWLSRKAPTRPGEARCFKCKKSRPFEKGTETLKRTKPKVLTISGNCAVCGGAMNMFASAKAVSLLEVQNERKCTNNAA